MLLLFLIVTGAMVLFFTEALPVELTALLVLAALLVTGAVTPEEGLTGFSNPATVTVTGLLVMSAAIEKTGALQIVARRILKLSRHAPGRVMAMLTGATGALSMFLNNTPVVAMQLPIAISLAEKSRLALSRLLMPISFAAILGGTCTMIGTSTNVLVGALAAERGWRIGLFDITGIGLVYFAVGMAYMAVVGVRLIPDRDRPRELSEKYCLREYIAEVEVLPGSALVGQPAGPRLTLDGGEPVGVGILAVVRGEHKYPPGEAPALTAGDLLIVNGAVDRLLRLRELPGLRIRHDFHLDDRALQSGQIVLAEGILAPASRLVGATLKEADFRRTYGVVALAVRRHGKILREKVGRVRLSFGDTLLLQGDRQRMDQLGSVADFLMLERIKLPQPRRDKIPLAVGIFLTCLVLMGAGVLPLTTAVIVGALLMLLTRCLRLQELYNVLPFKIILLLGCLIPLERAMERSGAADGIAHALLRVAGDGRPLLVLALLAVVTLVLTEIMSNTASAVLMAPVAFALAAQLGVSPKPLVLAVMFSASFSFLTPVGYQTNTMIYDVGGYRFTDFARVGAPLTALLLSVSVALIPLFWPF
ncbi:MAG TPA: SLC13 family permease [Acidobacteriota bacterium]|nr:SLC13 family permease [Acidobacteriota bacterium]HQG92961.1 SLC13 family permease [Acidobacteriota bacterium]HQK87385.1 SLC13 family permease [Acidobacteriota bacterium]